MHYNFNHGNWLALTSTGVRQAKSAMVQRMSTPTTSTISSSTTTSPSQSSASHRPKGERTSLQNVIYEEVDRRRTVSPSDAAAGGQAGDKLPITQERHQFDGISRSSYLINGRPSPQQQQHSASSQLATESDSSRLGWSFWPTASALKKWHDRQLHSTQGQLAHLSAHSQLPQPSVRQMFTAIATSRNSQREKRSLPKLQLDMSFQEVQIISQRRHKAQRWMALSSEGHLTLQPDDSNDSK